MEQLINIFIINGKSFVCELKEPFLNELISLFLDKNVESKSNIAVAVNNELVERSKWKKKRVNIKDKIEIVAPFFGG